RRTPGRGDRAGNESDRTGGLDRDLTARRAGVHREGDVLEPAGREVRRPRTGTAHPARGESAAHPEQEKGAVRARCRGKTASENEGAVVPRCAVRGGAA